MAGRLTGPDTSVGPVYKVVVSIPEGLIDNEFLPVVIRDIMGA